MSNFLLKNKLYISSILLMLMMYFRCVIGVFTSYAVLLDCLVDGLAFLYIVFLLLKEKSDLRELVFKSPIIWTALFFIMLIGYKFAGLGNNFSTQVAILTMGAGVLIYFLLSLNKGHVKDIVLLASVVIPVGNIITSIIYDKGTIGWWFARCFARFGLTPGSKVLDTANLCILMVIPILYELIVNKKIKAYLPVAFLICFAILTTGSKAALGALVFVFVLFFICRSKEKKQILISVGILIALAVVGTILIFKNYMLYRLIGERIVEFVTTAGNTDYDYTTSTGQRMASIHAALEHWSETPIFGHGFYAFQNYDYSAVQANFVDGELVGYNHQMLHCTFVELLFSFGIFGIVMYFWFPLTLFVKTLKSQDKRTKLLCIAYLVSMFVIDLSLDMYYKYLTPYFTYMVVYCLLKEKNEK